MTTLRRDFLALPFAAAAAPQPAARFQFVHLTDPHIQPERRAAEGCRECFRQIAATKADFALAGGDLVFDAAEQSPQRARRLFDLYGETIRHLDMPVHQSLGNHDVFATHAKSGVGKDADGWGKKLFEDRFGRRFYSFRHKGWHFVVLDSVEITPDGSYRGAVDAAQLEWLQSDLAGTSGPVVVMTHIPLLSAAPKVIDYWGAPADKIWISNAAEVMAVLEGADVRMVLQGHTHICERVEYKGCQYITSGAVCGNWWKGPHRGFAEGYGLITVEGGQARWEYRTYGFRADPE